MNLPHMTYTIHSKVLEVAGKTLVDPHVVPPSAGHEVSKPFVSQLMGCYRSDVHLVQSVGLTLLVKKTKFPKTKYFYFCPEEVPNVFLQKLNSSKLVY